MYLFILVYTYYHTDPTVTVTINEVSGNHGESVTLTCSASGVDLNGATYSFYNGGTVLADQISSNTQSVLAELFNAGGEYYCEVTVSPVYLDVSGSLTVRSINNGSVSVTSKFKVHCNHTVHKSIAVLLTLSVCVDVLTLVPLYYLQYHPLLLLQSLIQREVLTTLDNS